MNILKWLGNICWRILWGRSGQSPPPTPEIEPEIESHAEAGMAAVAECERIIAACREPTPTQKHRQAQLDWQARFQAMMETGGGVEPLTQDSPGLPFAPHLLSDGQPAPLLLTSKNLINPACLLNTDENGRTDNSEFPAYLRKLHEEAMDTDEGKLVADRQGAAEKYAKRKGIDLEDPESRRTAPSVVRPHIRYIDPKKVNSQHGPIRESAKKRSGGDA